MGDKTRTEAAVEKLVPMLEKSGLDITLVIVDAAGEPSDAFVEMRDRHTGTTAVVPLPTRVESEEDGDEED